MTVTILSLLSLAVIVLLSGVVFVAVIFSRSLQKVLDNADRVHSRSQEQMKDVLDRLMAKNFEEFKVYTLADQQHGDFIEPEPSGDRPWAVGQFQVVKNMKGEYDETEVSADESG